MFQKYSGLSLRTQRNRPDKRAIIINDVHGIQTAGTRRNRHRTAEVNENTLQLLGSTCTLPNLWNRRTSLFSQDAVLAFRGWGRGINAHTFDGLRTSHIKDRMRATV